MYKYYSVRRPADKISPSLEERAKNSKGIHIIESRESLDMNQDRKRIIGDAMKTPEGVEDLCSAFRENLRGLENDLGSAQEKVDEILADLDLDFVLPINWLEQAKSSEKRKSRQQKDLPV